MAEVRFSRVTPFENLQKTLEVCSNHYYFLTFFLLLFFILLDLVLDVDFCFACFREISLYESGGCRKVPGNTSCHFPSRENRNIINGAHGKKPLEDILLDSRHIGHTHFPLIDKSRKLIKTKECFHLETRSENSEVTS